VYLSEIFRQLAVGEIYNISLGGEGCKGVPVSDYPMLVAHVNLGLTELYKRFPLRMRSLVLARQPDMAHYRLHSDYAVNNSGSVQPVRYILDTPENPFQDDILKVEKITNPADNSVVPLNDPHSALSLHTSEYDVIEWQYAADEDPVLMLDQVIISYKAKPDQILADSDLQPYLVEVRLPDSLLEALLLYIGSRIHTNLNIDGSMGEGNNYYGKFEAACKKVENLGLLDYPAPHNIKLEMRGWV